MRQGRISRGAILLPLLATFAIARPRAASARPRVGEQVPDFAFTDFSGRVRHLSDFSGRYVLLDFWATWCGPCVKEVPTLREAGQLYGTRGLEIVGMNSDKHPEKAREFIVKNRIPWPQSAPASTKKIIEGPLKVQWYPTLILLNPQRKVLFVSGNGKRGLKATRLLQILDQLLPRAAAP